MVCIHSIINTLIENITAKAALSQYEVGDTGMPIYRLK